MKLFKFTHLALLIFILFSTSAFGQNNNIYKGKSTFSTKISFKEIEAWDKAHPVNVAEKKRPNKEVFEYPEFSLEKKKILYLEEKSGTNPVYKGAKDPSPLPDLDFLGLDDNGNSIPPDVNGAAGPEHLMVTLNTETRIMDKAGNPISTMGTGAIWYPVPGSAGIFDPKISYDQYENRWIFIMASSSDPASSRLMVAVSENYDPTGNWYIYTFDADATNTHWFDYPNVGFNKKWIVVSGNMFGAGYYSAIFVLNKADLYNNAPEAGYTRIERYDGFTFVPAVTYDLEEEDVYMVTNAGGNNNGYGYLNLWKVTGDIGNEEIIDLGLIGIPEPWGNGSYANGGNFAPQLGTTEKINTVDARMENMVYRNGKLWCVHHVYLPADNPTRCSVQWFELALDGTILQHGRVDDENGNMCYAFATIAVNAKEDVMIGYGRFSPEQYASSGYSFRYADDPPNTLRDSYQFKDGLAPYVKKFGGDRNRWGDYTATWVDPADDLDFWTLQEYADLPDGSQDQWSTWWAYVNIDAAPKAGFSANINSVPTGSGVNFTDLSKYGPTEWLWIFEGGTPSSSNDQNPENIIYPDTGLFDVTLIATNYLGSDTLVLEDFIYSNTSVLPEVYFTVADTLPCLGDTVLFEDHSVYNPIEWQWDFVPDYVTYVNGTTENSQKPEVVFDYPFKYKMSLTATNLNGSSSLAKTGFINSGGLYLPFNEDFEFLDFSTKAWTIENPDDKITWEITTVGGNEPGQNAAYVNIKSYSGFNERDRLISPLINLTDYREASLDFEYAYAQRFSQYTDSLIVYISDNCGSAWTRLLQMGEDSLGGFATHVPSTSNFFPEQAEDWCGVGTNPECISIDLTPWAGNPNIQIMFESFNGFGNNIFVDNVNVEGVLSSIDEDKTESNIHVFPNPTTGAVHIIIPENVKQAQVSVFNSQGAEVFQFSASTGISSFTADLSKYGDGIYFIRVLGGDRLFVEKVILK